VHWRLAAGAEALFADRHADLSVDLINSIRDELGPEALERVVRSRADRQLSTYRAVLDGAESVSEKVQLLVGLRNAEGYLAEATAHGDTISLIEHHCPILSAASTCDVLCHAELEVFRQALGPGAEVQREQLRLDGGRRCAYRITIG
jgi:predicted ArsR family transcriptional regulator